MDASRLGNKSMTIAYLCWLTGGIFGLHHLYLGRDKHAFITFATLGGYLTLGLVRDLWRLPEYVKDANNDAHYLKWLHDQIKTNDKPPSSLVRQSGQMIVGNMFAFLVGCATPTELLPENIVIILKLVLVPFASALGVWLVGNVGRHEGSIKWPLIAAYMGAIPSQVFNISHGSFSTLAAMMVFNRYCKRWRPLKKSNRSFFLRLLILVLCAALYLSLLTSWVYFECTIEDPETQEQIKCRTAIRNFLEGPAYRNFAEAIWILVEQSRHQGFQGLWEEIMQEFDVSGRSSAYQTLGLSDSATPQEILAAYKRLSRENHPDKEKDETKKAEKHEKFIQVQEAFMKLESKVQRYKLQEQQRNSDGRDEL